MALTLREVCGLTTEEIARAFHSTPSTLAQHIVRAKAKIRDARIPYEVPPPTELLNRLDTVLHVIYLVLNEGYSASFGTVLTRADFPIPIPLPKRSGLPVDCSNGKSYKNSQLVMVQIQQSVSFLLA